ncbi:MAG TPA: DUF1559 domain-containing protein, partial [Lacipirellulaceae bacterium]|nr:DUF1559 domain-containing protein [Lacipirellulaceae bacterium]
QSYVAARGALPAGAVARPDPANPATPHTFYRWSALAQLLPYMEQSAAMAQLDLDAPMYGNDYAVTAVNRAGVQTLLPELLCPSDRGVRVSAAYGPTNYAACSGRGAGGGTPFEAEGIFFINSAVRPGDILGGTTGRGFYQMMDGARGLTPGWCTRSPRPRRCPTRPARRRRCGTSPTRRASRGPTASTARRCTTTGMPPMPRRSTAWPRPCWGR